LEKLLNEQPEYADYDRVGALKILERSTVVEETSCPWTGPLL
jgi:hypothetical protein